MQRVVILLATSNGQTNVAGVFGPYEDTQAASDALEILRDIELPMGLRLHLGQRPVEEPSALASRVQEFAC